MVLGKVLEKISRPQEKKVWDITGQRIIKPCFDYECSKLIDQWKQAKLQLLQNPSQINGDNCKI
jgi:hypothetical protein